MSQNNLTALIQKINSGDQSQLNQIYAILYNDIKAVAGHQINLLNSGETITPTVLANECYLKLLKSKNIPITDRRHFMQYLAKSMRSFLLDVMRSKHSLKRNAHVVTSSVSQYIGYDDVNIRFMDIDRMLDIVEEVDVKLAEILQYKLIFNLTFKEIGELLNKSERQVQRLWKQAKAMLLALMDTNKETNNED